MNELLPVGSTLGCGDFRGSLVIDQGIQIAWMDAKGQRQTAWIGSQELAALETNANRPEGILDLMSRLQKLEEQAL